MAAQQQAPPPPVADTTPPVPAPAQGPFPVAAAVTPPPEWHQLGDFLQNLKTTLEDNLAASTQDAATAATDTREEMELFRRLASWAGQVFQAWSRGPGELAGLVRAAGEVTGAAPDTGETATSIGSSGVSIGSSGVSAGQVDNHHREQSTGQRAGTSGKPGRGPAGEPEAHDFRAIWRLLRRLERLVERAVKTLKQHERPLEEGLGRQLGDLGSLRGQVHSFMRDLRRAYGVRMGMSSNGPAPSWAGAHHNRARAAAEVYGRHGSMTDEWSVTTIGTWKPGAGHPPVPMQVAGRRRAWAPMEEL